VSQVERLAKEHTELTRRYFLQLGAAGVTALSISRLWARDDEAHSVLTKAISKLDYLTREEDFINAGGGDPPGEQPVILCYKLNNEWLTSKRGGPVRMLVPDAYGNKSVKWLQRVMLTNNYQANDTYAYLKNDTVSHIKTRARFIHTPKKIEAGQPVPITGVAQVGMSGLSKVQYWLCPHDAPLAKDDPHFTKAEWKDADILPPPDHWGGRLPDGKLPPVPRQIDTTSSKPYRWPIRNTLAHWAALLTIMRPGQYDLRCRTIDANDIARPMPRPFPKSGNNAIQRVQIIVDKTAS
jgi:DMSO/TMAO reductase YedYZ molybdopterin-dependent catalytic subunit